MQVVFQAILAIEIACMAAALLFMIAIARSSLVKRPDDDRRPAWILFAAAGVLLAAQTAVLYFAGSFSRIGG